MKKIILLFAILVASCNAPVEEPKGSGAWAGDPEETFVVGSDEMTEMFANFIQAHNDRDIEAIQALEAEDIRIDLPDGTSINGAENHGEALASWFESDQNPQWSPFWVMPYVGSPSGQTWIVAGHSLTQNIGGEEVTVVQMIDAQIENGLIKWAIIYEKQSPINQN